MKITHRITLAAITALALTGLAIPAQAAPAAPTVHCEFTPTPENPAARPVHPPSATASAKGTAKAVLQTNYGLVAIELDKANAPCAVHNFRHLIRSWFYQHTQCFRLTASQRLGVLQCGDIYEVEKGGPGYRFPDEVTGEETYPRGTVAMGNQGPGTNGSQFFFVHSHANIDPKYSVLGRVVWGMDTLDRIVAAGIADGAEDGAPARPVRIHFALTS
ncbi:peptidylprolyl isomerase [Amycolatopsis magusensis]|uniref:peptidylprolyl isomerase n=1 Tax=Amycolatopsis magusensis TaxID=882444 RepID=UPI003C2F9F66